MAREGGDLRGVHRRPRASRCVAAVERGAYRLVDRLADEPLALPEPARSGRRSARGDQRELTSATANLRNGDALIVGIGLVAERVHDDRPEPGGSRADDVDARHVAHVPRIFRGDADRFEREVEDARVGLAHTDRARVDDALDLHADARSDLQHFLRGEPLRDRTVGVRDDADVHPGRHERAQAVDGAGNDARPQVADRELAVEMFVHVFAHGRVFGNAARGDVSVEVRAPARLPVELAFVVHRELRGGRVVRAIERVDGHVELGSRRAQRMRS